MRGPTSGLGWETERTASRRGYFTTAPLVALLGLVIRTAPAARSRALQRFAVLLVGFVLLLASSPTSVAAAPSGTTPYRIVDLGALPGAPATDTSRALAINATAEIVGAELSGPHPAFGSAMEFSAGGSPVALGAPAQPLACGTATRTVALDINAGGTASGYVACAFNGPAAQKFAVLFAGGSATVLAGLLADSISGLPAQSVAYAINDDGLAVGYSAINVIDTDGPRHAVSWTAGVATGLGALPGDIASVAYAINNAGRIVGVSKSPSHAQAVSFAKGKVVGLGWLTGDTDSAAFSINASGLIAGYSAGPSGFHAVIFSKGAVQPLGVLSGDVNSQALAINSAGDAVGFSDLDGYDTHAVLFHRGRALSLTSLIGSGTGWVLNEANAINDDGDIVGQGTHDGKVRAYLLVPQAPLPTQGADVAPPSPRPTAPPESLHLHVAYDYMVAAGPDGHSEAPSPEALQKVIDAFAAHGIALVIDPRSIPIPERHVIAFYASADPQAAGPDAVDFLALRAAYRPDLLAGSKYAIFGDHLDCSTTYECAAQSGNGPALIFGLAPSVTGQAALYLEGDLESQFPIPTDFVVTLGFSYERFESPADPFFSGAAFMHELGHTLGLCHGGGWVGDSTCAGADYGNWSPTYLSVMNYEYSFVGIPFAASVGSATIAGYRLDYSEQVLPTGGNTPGSLDESDLDEFVGLGSGTADLFFFTDSQCGFQTAPTNGPVDWDGDGAIDNHDATSDLGPNRHPGPCLGAGTIGWVGHADWPYVITEVTVLQALFPG
jgi:hypothetical protein